MILILKGADFSSHNIGTLDSWFITKAIGSGATVTSVTVAGASVGITIPGSIKKDSALEIVLTVADGIEFTASDIVVTMGDSSITPSISDRTITISIASVTNHVDIKVNIGAISGGGGSEGDDDTTDPTPDDTEIGTTTTFGSTNVEVTIIGEFSDFDFVNNCVVSTGGGSSCTLNTAGASGRISSATQILKVSGGETVTFSSSISGLQYALIEFTDKPCTISTLNKNGLYGQAWSTAASCTLHSNTKYLTINFNNGSSDMTADQLTSLKTAIALS